MAHRGCAKVRRPDLQTRLDANTRTPFARFVLTQQALIGGSGASEPDEVSLLHILFANRQAPQAEGPETDLFYGAAGQIPELIARRIGDSIVLRLPGHGYQHGQSWRHCHSRKSPLPQPGGNRRGPPVPGWPDLL